MAPLGDVAVIGALASAGAYVRRPCHNLRVRAQSAVTMVSWAVLWFATSSSFAARGMMNLIDHMIGHILVMFLVPMGLIAGATVRSYWWLLSTSARRRWLRWWYVGRTWRSPAWIRHPVWGAVALNGVMVAAHLPRDFDATMTHPWAMGWLMEPAFLLSGLWFFHFIIPAAPRPVRTRLRWQLAIVLITMLEMLIMAMAMSIFTTSAWYSVMIMPAMPGMSAVTPLEAFHQQQSAAALLWICGDFWAVPCLVLVVRRLVQRDGSLLAALDRQSRRWSESPVS